MSKLGYPRSSSRQKSNWSACGRISNASSSVSQRWDSGVTARRPFSPKVSLTRTRLSFGHPQGRRWTDRCLANHLSDQAGNAGSSVEDTYGAIVLAIRTAEETGTMLQERFPKLLVNPCRLRALSKVRDGIFGIPEIAQIYSDAQLLAHFIRDHPFSRKAFAALVRENGGSLPVPATTQDFGAVQTLLDSLCSTVNADCFATLIRDDQWMDISSQRLILN